MTAAVLTIARWERGDHGEHLSVVPFPAGEILRYAEGGFTRVQKEQRALLGGRRRRRQPSRR